MAYNVVEPLRKTDFLARCEREFNKILSNGVIWIDKSVFLKNFCMQNDFNSEESSVISCLEFEEADNMTDEELYLEILKTFGRLMNQII